jgi:hypothetical protein
MAKMQHSPLQTTRLLAMGVIALSLSACAGSDKIDLKANKNVDEAIEAATGPLQDLNLRRQEIPQLLIQAAVNPYARSKKIKCADIKKEVAELDELLGPDVEPKSITLASSNGGLAENLASIDDIEVPETMSLVDGAGGMVRDKIMGEIRSKTDILPFRSIIRRISGASSHQKKLAAAYEAGKLRRAYLKGLADVRFGERCLAKPAIVEAKAKTTATE